MGIRGVMAWGSTSHMFSGGQRNRGNSLSWKGTSGLQRQNGLMRVGLALLRSRGLGGEQITNIEASPLSFFERDILIGLGIGLAICRPWATWEKNYEPN